MSEIVYLETDFSIEVFSRTLNVDEDFRLKITGPAYKMDLTTTKKKGVKIEKKTEKQLLKDINRMAKRTEVETIVTKFEAGK